MKTGMLSISQKKTKLGLLFVIALIVQLMAMPMQAMGARELSREDRTIDYIALGDSLASGINSENELANGYADFLAKRMDEAGKLKSYNKGFSMPGYTTTEVLDDILNHVVRPVYGTGYPEAEAEIQAAIADAEIITISAGANDVLAHIVINHDTGDFQADFSAIMSTLQKVKNNYKSIIENIRQLNPDARIYVMGYYNPFPSLPEELQPQLKILLTQMNNAIRNGIADTGAVFVQTGEAMAEDTKSYLPNPLNIHPSEAGYKRLTEQFWKVMSPEIVEPVIVLHDVVEHWAEPWVIDAVSAKIVSGYPGDLFKPEASITRAEYVKMLANAMQWSGEGSIKQFADREKIGSWAATAVGQAVELGVVAGYADGTFRPNAPITRAEIAIMLAKAAQISLDEVATTGFADDSDIPDWSKKYVAAVHELGVVQGKNGNKFAPNEKAKRAEAVVMVLKIIDAVKAKQQPID